jgi:hypothetical protein
MRINQIMEADGGLAKQSAVIARLQNAGGDVIGTATSSNGDVAQIGINGDAKSKVYFVVYPDGTFDRFQGDAIVIYRTGYTGPAINDPKESARRIMKAQQEKEERAERKERQAAIAYQQKLNAKRNALVDKYRSVVIPPQFKELCDKAGEVMSMIMEQIGPDLRSGLASYQDGPMRDEETTRYYDPLVILDLVADRMYDFVNGHPLDSYSQPEITPQEWQAFHKLPIKYQLKVASQFAGSFDY